MNFKEYTVRVHSDHKEWLLNGKAHREDGPAIESTTNGSKWWFINGLLHREDGPAIELDYGIRQWYLNGKNLSEESFLKATKKDTYEGKVVEIDGKKYKLTSV